MTLRHPERGCYQFVRLEMDQTTSQWVRLITTRLVVIFWWVRMRPKVTTLAVGLGPELLRGNQDICPHGRSVDIR